MLEKLKQEVFEANHLLPHYGLVTFTWGNVSGIDRELGYVVIKPSGIPYEDMKVDDMVIVNLDGDVIEGHRKPSSDLKTHLEIYKHFNDVLGVVHTHSQNATSWAQAKQSIPALGTTHADYFYGEVPCTREMTNNEIAGDYEKSTGDVIVEHFVNNQLNPNEIPAVLVASHGPFTWGSSPQKAVENAVVLEEIATMALKSRVLNQQISTMQDELLDKHFLRKHGAKSYYGQ